LEWLGKQLPDWSERCPVAVTIAAGESPSFTGLVFADGKVSSQAITLVGPLNRLLKADLGREITHIVIAHHFGCPAPRWADEGIATLSSDEVERKRTETAMEGVLAKARGLIPLDRLFSYRDYPSDVTVFCAEAYSVTRFLVESSGRDVFLEFVSQGMRDGWAKAAKQHYGYGDLVQLETAWFHSMRHAQKTKDATKYDPNLVSIDADGKTHKYYTLVAKLVRAAPNRQADLILPKLIVTDGTHVRLFQKDGTWTLDRARDQDVRTASTVLEAKVTERPSGKVRLDLFVLDNDVKRTFDDDTLMIGNSVSTIREIEVGKELRTVLTDNGKGIPRIWLEFSVNEGVPKN
jgi:hypothetical protein